MHKTARVVGPAHFSTRQTWRHPVVLVGMGLVLAGAVAVFFTTTSPYRGPFLAVLLLQFGVAALFWGLELKIVLTREGVYARLRPFHRRYRYWPWGELAQVYLRPYQAVREYGGWGLRWGGPRRGAAWILGGQQGLQLVDTKGQRWLLGTTQPSELAAALQQLSEEPLPSSEMPQPLSSTSTLLG